ncbi:MAG: hypothetical protein BA864_06030 [Desulfuromonadales bacterium C00003093]|nr:MAG: hypothetical protein BA864_06030 [Desulfuromonadales bacterium C00003093]
MPRAKLSSKAQIVLPAPIRRQLNIKPGDELEISAEDNVITIRKSPQSATDALDACGSDIWRDYEKELDEARDQWTP